MVNTVQVEMVIVDGQLFANPSTYQIGRMYDNNYTKLQLIPAIENPIDYSLYNISVRVISGFTPLGEFSVNGTEFYIGSQFTDHENLGIQFVLSDLTTNQLIVASNMIQFKLRASVPPATDFYHCETILRSMVSTGQLLLKTDGDNKLNIYDNLGNLILQLKYRDLADMNFSEYGRKIVPSSVGGIEGPQGPQGIPGKSAYEIAVEVQGFQGTEEEWLESLVGPEGPMGPIGPQGPIGPEGPAGKPGPDAYEWALENGEFSGTRDEWYETLKGSIGPQGPIGPEGPQGIQGPKGDPGNPFIVTKIYSSIQEMNDDFSGTEVKEGQFVLIETNDVENPDNSKLFVKGSTQYDFVTDLSGAQGIRGPEGPEGPQGPTGAQGEQGATGATGPQGNPGQGVPAGGTRSQILGKRSDSDYDTEWIDPSGEMGPQGPDGNPLGTILLYMGLTPPENYLACDGTVYNISDYSELANHFKEQLGSINYFGGDGITTFAVPDMSGKVTINTNDSYVVGETGGEEKHLLSEAEMPSHSHIQRVPVNGKEVNWTYQLNTGGATTTYASTAATSKAGSWSSVTTTSKGTSQPHNNMPPYMVVLYCIKAVGSKSANFATIEEVDSKINESLGSVESELAEV